MNADRAASRQKGGKHWVKSLLLAMALALVPQLGPLHAQQFPPKDQLEELLRYMVEDGEAPAVVLGVVDPDGNSRIATWAGPDSDSVDARTLFEIGSVTKTFTATLLADMVLSGDIGLEDPVELYLPQDVNLPSVNGRVITLLDLATHRSGLPEFPPQLESVGPGGLAEPYTWSDAYAFLADYELPWAPGTRRAYSSLGYGLLGHALGRALGTTYREALRTRVLRPLGMEGARFTGEVAQEAELAQGHVSGVPVRSRQFVEVLDGAGTLRLSGQEMLKYVAANLGPSETRLQEAMRLAHTVQGEPDPRGGGQGLGWGITVFPDGTPIVGHGGTTLGFRSQVALNPDRAVGAIILANDYDFADGSFVNALVQMAPVPDDWMGAESQGAVVQGLGGTYRAEDIDREIYIRTEEGGRLTYQPSGNVRTPLYQRSDSSFYMLRGPWTLTFRTGPGDALRLVMTVDAREPADEGRSTAYRRVSSETPEPRVVAGHAGRFSRWGLRRALFSSGWGLRVLEANARGYLWPVLLGGLALTIGLAMVVGRIWRARRA